MKADAIEALRNLRTGKLFIVLEYAPIPGMISVINPEGNVLNASEEIFETDNPILIQTENVANTLTAAQVQAFLKYQNEQNVLAENRAKTTRQSTTPPVPSSNPSKAPSHRARRSGENSSIRTRKEVTWNADSLTFYRHYIEPMRGSDVMKIHVNDVGVFKMTKDEFLRSFSHVVVSQGYKQTGVAKVEIITEEILRFLVRD